ncbi:MAG: hypothetical protein JNM81_18060 [Rhodospirillaceae bacterium]|nr:hypothetical protein [Rhodospirillaceae bacterium]
MTTAPANTNAPLKTSGPERPTFFPDASNDMLLDLVFALSNELAATRARLDAMERVMAERNILEAGAVDNWVPGPEAATARVLDAQAYTRRVFHTLSGDLG